MRRDEAYANQINEGDRIEVNVIVDRAEQSGEDVVLHVSGRVVLKADDKVWRVVDG
jgi:hypothetical protein